MTAAYCKAKTWLNQGRHECRRVATHGDYCKTHRDVRRLADLEIFVREAARSPWDSGHRERARALLVEIGAA